MVVLIISLWAIDYKSKNDERWLSVKDKASQELRHYHTFLLALTVASMIVGTILGGMETVYVNFEIMIMVIFVLLGSRELAELFLLRKYDKTM